MAFETKEKSVIGETYIMNRLEILVTDPTVRKFIPFAVDEKCRLESFQEKEEEKKVRSNSKKQVCGLGLNVLANLSPSSVASFHLFLETFNLIYFYLYFFKDSIFK